MKPVTISEKLMYNTVRLETENGSCGTGSYFSYKFGEEEIPVLITNKHVINNNSDEMMRFFLHTANENGEPDGNIEVSFKTHWFFHNNHDICFCFINPLIEQIYREFGEKVYYITNSESIIPNTDSLQELSALEELVMVGYPIGLWDSRNNLPIFRKGYTASHPAIDFNQDGIGLIDMACFPGSSGSPIFILNEGGYRDKKGTTIIGKSRILLLGYLFSGPQYSATGELVIETIPTQNKVTSNTPVMINLGYYVKSSEILEFKSQIKKYISRQ